MQNETASNNWCSLILILWNFFVQAHNGSVAEVVAVGIAGVQNLYYMLLESHCPDSERGLFRPTIKIICQRMI